MKTKIILLGAIARLASACNSDNLNADLGARAALYRDADPANDPSTKTYGYCTSYHAR